MEQTDVKNLKPLFCRVYGELTGLPYYWTVKDGVGGKQLRVKLRRLMESLGKGEGYDEAALIEHYIRRCWEVGDEWERDRFGMATINSNYNSYIKRILDGTRQHNGIADSYKRQILAELYT